ncbi:MAG: hypothetical protein ACK56N_03620, partial [Betaproteobacteria bacterium]
MCIDAGCLRRDVGTQTELTAGQLIDKLEGAQVEIAPGAGQQRVKVLDQRHQSFKDKHQRQRQSDRRSHNSDIRVRSARG